MVVLKYMRLKTLKWNENFILDVSRLWLWINLPENAVKFKFIILEHICGSLAKQ